MLSRPVHAAVTQCLLQRRFASTSGSKLAPILYHYFEQPVPYLKGLTLQETLVARRVDAKTALQEHREESRKLNDSELQDYQRVANEDILLLLQHRPVYTTGRRDTDPEILELENKRLTAIGADYIATQRGGQTTYHGPGQLVGYPILDTSLMNMPTRQYVEAISDFLEKLVRDQYGIPLMIPPPHVGTYPSATTKIASIGIQIRHRITSHGFALNVTDEVKYWFDQIIACGSPDIKATSIESELRRLGKLSSESIDVQRVVPNAARQFGDVLRRDMQLLSSQNAPALYKLIQDSMQ